MSDVKRTSLIALLARLVGFTLGGAVLGFAAMLIGTSFLGGVQGGISQRLDARCAPWNPRWVELQGPKAPPASSSPGAAKELFGGQACLIANS
jgi:hypothetical protein